MVKTCRPHLSSCEDRDTAWAWEHDGKTVYLLNSNGEQIRKWKLVEPLKRVYVTDKMRVGVDHFNHSEEGLRSGKG